MKMIFPEKSIRDKIRSRKSAKKVGFSVHEEGRGGVLYVVKDELTPEQKRLVKLSYSGNMNSEEAFLAALRAIGTPTTTAVVRDTEGAAPKE